MFRRKIMAILPALLVLSACVSIKSDYQPITLYRLNQEAISAKNLGKINITFMIRNFTTASEFDTEHLLCTWDNSKVQPYYYHRWAADASEMMTDFFFTRYSKTQMFMGGVVGTDSWVVPDYFMEAKILEMMAYSSKEKSSNANYVNVSIQVSLARRSPLKIEKEIVYSDNYIQKIQRSDNLVSSIVPAMSKAVSQIADKLLLDIQSAVAVDQMKNNSKNKTE